MLTQNIKTIKLWKTNYVIMPEKKFKDIKKELKKNYFIQETEESKKQIEEGPSFSGNANDYLNHIGI